MSTPATTESPASAPARRFGESSFERPLRVLALSGIGLLLLASLYTLYFARDFILPLVLAVLLSFPLAPVVRALTRLKIPEALGAALVLAAFLAGVGYTGYRVYAPAVEWMARLPDELRSIREKFRELRSPVAEVSSAAKELEEQVQEITETEPRERRPVAVLVDRPPLTDGLFTRTSRLLSAAVLTLILLYFLLASGDFFVLKAVRILPRLEDKKKVVEISRHVERHISSYLFTVTVINIGQGIAVGAAMVLLEMPNPLLWGVMATVLNFIPYLGAIIGAAVLTIAALPVYDDLGHALLVPATYYAITAVEGWLVTPLIVGRRLILNPLVIFVSLLFWGWIWGIAGTLLAVPILAAIKILCDHIEPLAPIGEFLGR